MSALKPVRIGRVHQDHARAQRGIEQFVNKLAIMVGNLGSWEHAFQTIPAQRGNLVEHQTAAGLVCPDRKHAGPGRRLKHSFGACQPAGARREPGEARSGRELLQLDLLFTTHALAGKQVFKVVKARGRLTRIGRYGQAGAVAKPHHLRQFERCMRIADRPAPLGIAAAEVGFEDGIAHCFGDRFTSCETCGQVFGG